MGSKTKIEWCDSTWSPVTGCTPVSAGCEHCYAKRLAERFPQIHNSEMSIFKNSFAHINYHPDRLDIPFHWHKPKRIFVCSMGDLFHNQVSTEYIKKVLEVIRKNLQHTFMILTKRPDNIFKKLNKITWEYNRLNMTWPNLWLGVTAENQEMADKRIPILLQIPAAKRFVSVEPMLGPIRLESNWNGYLTGWETLAVPDRNGDPEPYQSQTENLNWVICGPETAPGARPFNLDWARSLRDQCIAAGVPFFYKPGELDGKPWQQFPEMKSER